MKKMPFRVAFIGPDPHAMMATLSRLSPAFQPRVYRDWNELLGDLGPDGPELAAVWPGSDLVAVPLPIPLLALTEDEVLRGVAALEALLVGTMPAHPPGPESRLLGHSAAMAKVRGTLVAMARHSLPLLLTGENGTGKDLAASVVHDLSPRNNGPFVAVNCGAVPQGLAETEFFGCVRGAFTGAENRSGFCQQALGGTLFLDEVGELAPEIQAKLLRVLENKEIRRVGSVRVETAEFRLVCATNRDLTGEVKAGRFREDLFYRINVLPLKLPALRERIEDLPLLAEHFLASDALELDRPVRISPRALDKMAGYEWPGNLRQLRNVVLRAAVVHRVTELEPRHIDWDF